MNEPTNNTTPPASVVSAKFRRLPWRHKRVWLIIGAAIVLLAIVATLTTVIMHRNAATVATSKCSDTVLTEVGPLLQDPNDLNKLSQLVSKIQKIKGYDKDASCLYVVTVYYLDISDATNTNTNYVKLTKVYKPKVGYVASLHGVAVAPEALKARVDYLNSLNPTNQKNNQYLGPIVQ